MPAGFLRSFCQKTQLCKFHQAGACSKGRKCAFAHSESELQDLPDLRCTKLCPKLISTGSCEDTACLFAHSKEQLRRIKTPAQQPRKLAPQRLVEQAAAPRAQRESILPDGKLRCGAELDIACASTGFGRAFSGASECSTEASLGFSLMAESDSFSRTTTPMDDASFLSLSNYSSEASGTSRQPSSEREVGPPSSHKGDADDDSQVRVRPTRSYFHKTRLCSFHGTGRCRRGSLCRFAHDPEELKRQPDLSCTKLCPPVLQGSQCSLEGCTYAHSKEELRKKPSHKVADALPKPVAAAARPAPSAHVDTDSEDEEEALSLMRPVTRSTTLPAEAAVRFRVKNTFIELEMPETSQQRRRTQSAPPCLLRPGSAKLSSGAEEASPRVSPKTFVSDPGHRETAREEAPAAAARRLSGERQLPSSLPLRAAAPGADGLAVPVLPSLR